MHVPTGPLLLEPSQTAPLGPTIAPGNASYWETQPCFYATETEPTSNSGPSMVSDGYTYYHNRAYISMRTAYARNSCGNVGKEHYGTIVEIASTQLYSAGFYHANFRDAGFQFNFDDIEDPPSYSYYMPCDSGGKICSYHGEKYTSGVDWLNGRNDIDLGGTSGTPDNQWMWSEAYAPVLLLPTQVRDIDPAWQSCDLNLFGLSDPPKKLTEVATAAEPTAPVDNVPASTTAQPGDSPVTSGSGPTTTPVAMGDDDPVAVPDQTAADEGQSEEQNADRTQSVANSPSQDVPVEATASVTSNDAAQVDDGEASEVDGDGDGNGANNVEDLDAPKTTQNAGGAIASLLGNGGDKTSIGDQTTVASSRNIGGYIVSMLGMSSVTEESTAPNQNNVPPSSISRIEHDSISDGPDKPETQSLAGDTQVASDDPDTEYDLTFINPLGEQDRTGVSAIVSGTGNGVGGSTIDTSTLSTGGKEADVVGASRMLPAQDPTSSADGSSPTGASGASTGPLDAKGEGTNVFATTPADSGSTGTTPPAATQTGNIGVQRAEVKAKGILVGAGVMAIMLRG